MFFQHVPHFMCEEKDNRVSKIPIHAIGDSAFITSIIWDAQGAENW